MDIIWGRIWNFSAVDKLLLRRLLFLRLFFSLSLSVSLSGKRLPGDRRHRSSLIFPRARRKMPTQADLVPARDVSVRRGIARTADRSYTRDTANKAMLFLSVRGDSWRSCSPPLSSISTPGHAVFVDIRTSSDNPVQLFRPARPLFFISYSRVIIISSSYVASSRADADRELRNPNYTAANFSSLRGRFQRARVFLFLFNRFPLFGT